MVYRLCVNPISTWCTVQAIIGLYLLLVGCHGAIIYTVSQKYTLDVIDCNLKKDDPILVIFGKGEHTLTLSSLTLGIG